MALPELQAADGPGGRPGTAAPAGRRQGEADDEDGEETRHDQKKYSMPAAAT
jgi:hypothetical protein